MSFIAELKRRNVFRVGAAYAVASWILLQALDVVGEILELPPWGGKLILVLVVVGFFLALFFAWAFELTPEGIKRDHEVDRSQSIAPQTGRKLDRTIIALLVLALAYFIWESRFMERGAVDEPAAEPSIAASGPAPASADNDAFQASTVAPTSAPPGDAAAEPVNPRSIAVLPFANRSLKEEDLFFTEGIHDDLLTQLAKIRDLKVISRTSVMKYRDTEKTIPEIAGELQVATILEGGVQRAGQRIRINAQLIDVTEDQHLWAETFDREMTVENIFDIQSEITRQIVQAVRGEVTDEERETLASVPTSSLEAYEFYLRAQGFANRADYSVENYQSAEVWARRAVEADPDFALAWALLVEVHGQAIWLGYDASDERRRMAQHALDMARRHGPDLPELKAAEAEFAYRVENDFLAARDLFRQAHEAVPGDADILFRYAVAQRRTPEVPESINNFLEALELDPYFARIAATTVDTLVNMNELERAAGLADRWVIRFPDVGDLKAARVLIHAGMGEMDAARSLRASLPPSTSSAYYLMASELPFWARDLEASLAVWELPEMTARQGDRGFASQSVLYQAWALLLIGEEARGRVMLGDAIDDFEALPPTGFYTDGFEQAYAGLAYALDGQADRAIAAADEAVRIIPEERDIFFGIWMSKIRAQVLALAGRRNEALAEIERLLQTPYRFNKWQLHQDVRWDFFRDDERFNELVRPAGAPKSPGAAP